VLVPVEKGLFMLDRRSSLRLPLERTMVREMNGDYFFSLRARDLSEDGIFLENKQCVSTQEPFSSLSFILPNGKHLSNVTARIVREVRKGERPGCAYEFMNLSEEARIELKRLQIRALPAKHEDNG
jgi:PilZ domain